MQPWKAETRTSPPTDVDAPLGRESLSCGNGTDPEPVPADIGGVPATLKTPPKTQGDMYAKGTYVDEWGCVFTNVHEGIIGEVNSHSP